MNDAQKLAGQELIALTPVGPALLSPSQDHALSQVAEKLRSDDPALAMPAPIVQALQARSMPGIADQRLLFDDFSVISHIEGVLGLEFYTSRAFVRAGEGDLVLGTFAPIPGYDAYMAERLGLGLATYLTVPKVPGAQPYAVCQAALAQAPVLAQITALCGQGTGALWLHPYMGHTHAWQLAGELQERLARKIEVVAPTPVLCDRVNNKVWFLRAVRETLGDTYAVASQSAANADEIVLHLLEMANHWPRLSLKLADSASGMGTSLLASDALLATPSAQLHQQVTKWLAEKDWRAVDSPPISIEPWLETLGSPSVQLWIPPLEAGMPWVEGIYDQLFYPDDPFVFLGSVPSQLPAALQAQLCDSGAALGRVFQQLGYVGRCSFDTILTGQHLADAQIVYVECNGRWGGTSTPMTLLNRIFGDYRSLSYIANDFDDHRLVGMPFDEFVQHFDDILFDARTGEGWAIVYNVGCLAPAGKFDVIAFGKTITEAQERQTQFRSIVEARLSSIGALRT